MVDTVNKLTAEEAEGLIRDIARFGDVIFSRHCFKDSMRNRNYDDNDLTYVLLNGQVKEPPEFSEKDGDWKYKVEGRLLDGEKTAVFVVIVDHRTLLCVTIMPNE